jgi:hypothetical protein
VCGFSSLMKQKKRRQAPPLDLLRLVYQETHVQNILEASGYRTPTCRTPVHATCLIRADPMSVVRRNSLLHLPAARFNTFLRDGQTSPHRPQLVVSRSTCPSISPPPPRKQLCTRSCSNKHTPSASEIQLLPLVLHL